MKNLKTLMAVGFLAVITSCSTTKQTTDAQATANKQENNRGRSNQENTIERTKTTNSAQFPTERTASSENTRNNDAVDTARMQEMYSSLKMDDSQIKRFESEWGSSTSAWKKSNRNKTMNNFERVEYQDRILKNILDESQFESYQEWARENPGRD